MQQPNRGGHPHRPKVVLLQDYVANSVGEQSELDLDLYETDEVPDSPSEQLPGMSFSGLAPILDRDSVISAPQLPVYTRGVAPIADPKPSDVSSQNYTHQDTSSSAGGSSRTHRLHGNRPMNPHPTIRTNFTTSRKEEDGNQRTSIPHGTQDRYETLSTPPGDSILPASRPEEQVHPACVLPTRAEMSMRAEWIIGLVIVGLGLGIAIASQKPDAAVAYWFTTFGDLYVRMTTCLTLPLAFCQLVICSAELVNNEKLRRAWKYTVFYFVLTAFLSSWLGIVSAMLFQPHFRRHNPTEFRLAHPQFAIKCPDGQFVELQPAGNMACTGTQIAKNTTIPRLIDANQRLGVEEPVANVSVSGYVFAMIEVFFPQNLMQSLARDNYLSALIIAIMLGIAVGRSYTCARGEIRQSRNPLFRLFTHVYLSLFAMHDWVQALALWATVPILIGAVLTMPNIMDTLSLTRLYMASVTVVGFGQCLVVVPTIFYVVVRQNPYRWMHKMLAPISYGMVLQNAFLSLPLATKAALRTHEISPSTFGAVYPLLSALNRSHFAIGCPTAVLYVAAFSGCDVNMTAGNVLAMFGVTFLGCIGDTALPRAGMSYFLMVWRTFCVNEDTPSSVLMIATIGILIYRVSACVGTTTNLLLTRIVAHAVDHEDAKWQQQATEAEGLAHEHDHRGD